MRQYWTELTDSAAFDPCSVAFFNAQPVVHNIIRLQKLGAVPVNSTRVGRCRAFGLGLVSVVGLALAACGSEPSGSKEGSAQAADEVVLHRGIGPEPNTLDPHHANGQWEGWIISEMTLGLYTDAPDASAIKGAAASHEVSEDGLTHIFTIREDMNWSDGVPVTAQDFIAGWQRILDPATAAEYASLIYPFKNAKAINEGILSPRELGARALDDKTIELEVEYPLPYINTLLKHYTTYPIPRHSVEQHGDQWVEAGNYLANGPYRLAEWRPGSHVKLVRNPLFYDNAAVEIDTVYMYPTPDPVAALRRFQAGELDVNDDYPVNLRDQINETMPGVDRTEIALQTSYLSFNMARPPFDQLAVRKALCLSIDREVLTGKVLKTGEQPAFALVPPLIQNYVAAARRPQFVEATLSQEARNALARDLLAEAGYGPDNPLTVTTKYRLSGPRKRVMVAIQSMWKNVGINAKIEGKEVKIAYEDYRAGDFEIADAGWVADYNDPDNFLFLAKSDTGSINYSRYANPALDALIKEASEILDLEARAELLAEAEQIMLDDAPMCPIYFDVERPIVGPHISGWVTNAESNHGTRYLTIDESKRRTY